MIIITRGQARHLRAVFRRHMLGITHKGAIPPLVFRAEETKLQIRHNHASLAIEYVEEGTFRLAELIALPIDALADVEGRDDSPVILEPVGPESTVVRWQDHGIPQVREYTVPPIDATNTFPDPPAKFETAPAELLDALVEASRTCDESSTRYALGCIQLRGDAHQIVATDGRQLLIQGGFSFPWAGDVLVKLAPLLACKELPRDRALSIGRTEKHVVIKAGPWTLFLEIQTECRYPSVDRILPDERGSIARLQLNAEDAAFLLPALDSLPGSHEYNAPATIDLNGWVAIRARGVDPERPTELVLSRSSYTGEPIRFQTNREFIGRAIRLGFNEIMITDADMPIVCRDGRRVYGWQTLNKDSVVEPSDDITRIASASSTSRPAPNPEQLPKVRTPVSENPRPTRSDTKSNAGTNGHATPKVGTTGLAALIEEAEALHKALAATKAQTARLVVALRKHRRRERLVATTLASLKQLKLQEVAD